MHYGIEAMMKTYRKTSFMIKVLYVIDILLCNNDNSLYGKCKLVCFAGNEYEYFALLHTECLC